jgi:periplasmic divalent cation tolerance protein
MGQPRDLSRGTTDKSQASGRFARSRRPVPYAGPMPNPPALICFCTCPEPGTAERIATALVDERLAACVNILPGLRSVYRWQDRVETADEVLLLVKTSAAAYPALQDRLRELHPYELPELLAVESASGLPAYLQWVADETRPKD